MPEMKEGCVKPARGPILQRRQPRRRDLNSTTGGEELARVGKEAIDFEANAFVEGVGFQAGEAVGLQRQMDRPLLLSG